MKKLYLIEQNVNDRYDTYSDAVVCATSEDEAKKIHPDGYSGGEWWKIDTGSWCDPEQVKCHEIGVANADIEIGVVCSSFHAG